MKLNGIVGKGSGRLGSSVFTVRGGEQIVREYTPNVANPNTDAQKAQRAKFKLLSQVAAIAADGLLFPKVGNVSRRNAFVAANMPAVTFSGGIASLQLPNMLIGPGYEPITVTRQDLAEQGQVAVTVNEGEWDGLAFVTIDSVSESRVIGISGMLQGMDGVIPVIPARMSRTQIVVAAWRYRDGATRAKYGNIIPQVLTTTDSRISLGVTDLVASGEIIVSQTVVAVGNADGAKKVKKS